MARDRLTDFLQVGNFHVLDVSISLPLVLTPIFGFARVNLPTWNVELYPINEGNYEYPRKVVKGASVEPLVLEQGVQLVNSDFGDWIRKATVGRSEPKNLLIIQFTRLSAGGDGAVNGAAGPISFELAARLPGRAWLCKACRPVSYKPGSDFDGMIQDISIASLTIDLEEFQEISLGI